MNNEIQVFTETVRYDEDQQYVFIKPLCDLFDIDADNQRNTILRDAVLQRSSITKPDEFIFGDNRARLALTKVGFVRWVQLLNPDLVRPELKDKLINYQMNIMEWITGRIDEEMVFRKTYKRKDELKRIIKDASVELKACEKFITSYLESKTYQKVLDFDIKALN